MLYPLVPLPRVTTMGPTLAPLEAINLSVSPTALLLTLFAVGACKIPTVPGNAVCGGDPLVHLGQCG
jgi:hypothetical protein